VAPLYQKNLVSYIIPCFNCEHYILDCLQSVFSQVDVDVEAVVIDDGSSDRSVNRVQQFMNSNRSAKVSLVFHPGNKNLGVSASRNLGIQRAQGEFIGFLDADDMLLDTQKTFKQLSIFMDSPNIVLVHSGVKIIGEIPSEALAHERHFGQRSALGPYRLSKVSQSLNINCIANSTVIVKRQALASFSYTQLFQVEDFVLWHLLSLAGKFYCLPGQLVGYRFHAETATSRYRKSLLIQYYSSIEFKLALAAKSPSKIQSAAAFLSLFSSIYDLLGLYSQNTKLSHVPSANWILRLVSLLSRCCSRASCYAYRHFM